MNPILFPEDATQFNTNGIGRIKCISCKVTEERNGIYELEAEVSVSTPHYSDIKHSAILAVIPSDGATIQAFRIYEITKPMGGIFEVYAHHISYQLSFIPTKPFNATNVSNALSALKTNAMSACPFTFWTDKVTTANYKQMAPESIRARLGGQEGSILDVYGGEYEWDNWTVKLWNDRGSDKHVTLRYGKNITDIEQEESIDDVITGIVPYWQSEDKVVYYNGIVEADTVSNFPFRRTVPYDFSEAFETEPSAASLKATAERYIIRNKIGIPKVNIKVSFVALWQTEEYKDVAPLEHVKLCDTVTVYFEKLGISAQAQVVKTVYDCLEERYKSIELGEARSDFASTVVGLQTAVTSAKVVYTANKNTNTAVSAQMRQQINDLEIADSDRTQDIADLRSEFEGYETAYNSFKRSMEQAVGDVTDKINSAKGGYVVTHYNAQNQPYELLLMDNANISRAKNVWRWNLNGLGFSSKGYVGPFTTAITADGKIVADFITTGSLNAGIIRTGIMKADVIRAGLLADAKQRNYWNLETGEFKLAANMTKVGNQTLAQYIAANAPTQELTQRSVFNALTNNGASQGIYLTDGNLYINASYLQTGIITDQTGNNSWNLRTGALNLTGSITTKGTAGTDNKVPFTRLSAGRLEAGKDNGVGAWIDFKNSVTYKQDGVETTKAAMRVNGQALVLSGQIWTSHDSGENLNTLMPGVDFSISDLASTIRFDFTGAADPEDIGSIDADLTWVAWGLKFVNGILVQVNNQNGTPQVGGNAGLITDGVEYDGSRY